MPDLLLEIGTEEIPSRFMPPALESMSATAERMLQEQHVGHGPVDAVGTPRRLVLLARGLKEFQEKQAREVMGPAKKVAFDGEGRPTRACEGFAKGQGVETASLFVKSTPKGEYVFARREEGGRPVGEILPVILPALIGAIPFPKSMRWGDGTVRFARPIRWIAAVFGGEVVPFEYAGLASGNLSLGHRFMAPGAFAFSDPEGYFRKAAEAAVIVDHRERRKMIREALLAEARAQGGELLESDALLDEVNFLVEYPVVVCGSFRDEYLKVPPEVLVTSMRSHQKYFPVADRGGRLLPRFLAVSNVRAADMDVIARGNERVLSARLADAEFFWREDLKEPLAAKAEKLRKVVYQEKLGTSWEKMERFREVALHLARKYGLGDPAVVERAALLCKADLVTEMVGEFPELQGVMGRYYAREAGEAPEVCEAILEHYLPRFAGDQLPATPAGKALSLADKIDTVCGSFGIGQKPTGSEDPYGLRRQTLGIINIIMDGNLAVDLAELVGVSLARLEGKIDRPADAVGSEVMDFFRGRLLALLTQEGYRGDLVEAVLSSGIADLPDVRRRLRDLSDFCATPDFEPVAVAFKRVMNIIPAGFEGSLERGLLREDAEKELFRVFKEKGEGILSLKARRDYRGVLSELASIRPAVDDFFSQVMVMAEDRDLRGNRLALMVGLAGLFSEVADFTRITTV